MLKIVVNAVVFQVGWILCVLYGNQAAIAVAAICIIILLSFYRQNSRDLILIAAVVTLGWLGDSLLGFLTILKCPTNSFYPPFWLVTLWLLFAQALTWSLEWIIKRQLGFTLFSAIGGTLSYMLGVNLSDTHYGVDQKIAVITLASLWTVYGLAIHRIYLWWQRGRVL